MMGDGGADSAVASDGPVDAAFDAPSGPRCNPNAAFGAPTLVPNVNSTLGTFSIALTEDELTAFFTATDNGSDYVLKLASRGSKEAAFPLPTAGPALASITAETGMESFPAPSGDGLAVYFQRANATTFTVTTTVAVRAAPNLDFGSGAAVRIDGNSLVTAGHPQISASGLTLYWTDDTSFVLRSAARTGGPLDAFFQQKFESTMSIGNGRFALSADELTLYYGSPEIYVSTRASKNVQFGAGSLVPVLNSTSSDSALAVSADNCVLYLSSSRAGGVRAANIWIARRPQ